MDKVTGGPAGIVLEVAAGLIEESTVHHHDLAFRRRDGDLRRNAIDELVEEIVLLACGVLDDLLKFSGMGNRQELNRHLQRRGFYGAAIDIAWEATPATE